MKRQKSNNEESTSPFISRRTTNARKKCILPSFNVGRQQYMLRDTMSMSSITAEQIALLLKKERGDADSCENLIVRGRHIDYIKSFPLSLKNLCEIIQRTDSVYDHIVNACVSYLESARQSKSAEKCLWELLVFGVALLELYCQANFTGPELNGRDREDLFAIDDPKMHRLIVQHLECDGIYPFNSVDMPQLLLLARVIINFVATPLRVNWKEGISFSREGMISLPTVAVSNPRFSILAEVADIVSNSLFSASWWNARATILHSRLLQGQSYEQVPTLWQESMESFSSSLEKFCSIDSSEFYSEELCKFDFASCSVLPMSWEQEFECNEKEAMKLSSMILIEWGLACHHFNYGDKGQKSFIKSKEIAKLRTTLTAALGKRTKYQREDVAQLFLFASSATLEEHPDPLVSSNLDEAVDQISVSAVANELSEEQPQSVKEEGEKSEMLEVGRRVVTEATGGEEAALREVMLDNVETGVENIILEGGPKFKNKEEVDTGGKLSTLDQCILLALCLDVSNNNAADQLTHEEMMAYVERILQQANNWMIHSTGLLERSWIEFERRKTADRAMMQIQALIDQHSTKLTFTQASYQAVEDSAPMQERLLCIYQIVYPSIFELKRDLAIKYLRCQVFMSALNYFKELEMWDEVVTCYQLLDKPTRAELVVREQLKNGESPYMLTSLADLTGKEDFYERAWIISNRRFARARRTLGKICFDRGQFKESNDHLAEALSVQPLVHTAWYLKGLACMRMSAWEQGVEAFVRCVQLESEVGEAWANLGAIHMKMKNWPKAEHALQEAIKHKHDDFRILENLLGVSLALSKWKDAIRYMSKLVDLRFKQQQKMNDDKNVSPLHLRELAHVVKVAAVSAKMAADPNFDPTAQQQEMERSEEKDRVATLPDLANQVQALLEKITNTLKSDAEVWEIFAAFNEILGRYRDVMDTRLRQFRAASSAENWMKDEQKIKSVLDCAKALQESLDFKEVNSSDFYQIKSVLQSTARRMETLDGMDPNHVNYMTQLVQKVDEMQRLNA